MNNNLIYQQNDIPEDLYAEVQEELRKYSNTYVEDKDEDIRYKYYNEFLEPLWAYIVKFYEKKKKNGN